MAIPEVRLAALDVLTDVLEWRLAEERWARVTEIVQTLDNALSTGDLVALEAATVDLELAGPVRIIRVGATPQIPAPPPVRERINRMVHSLTVGEDRGKGSGRDQAPNQR
jgi:hypothetical protein